VLESRSALANYLTRPGVDGASGARGVRLGEAANARLLHLGVYPGGAPKVAAAVLPILGGPLPESPVRAAAMADGLVVRIAPDQCWLLDRSPGRTRDPGLEAKLRAAIPTDAGCVTTLDQARTRLLIEGRSARTLLGKLVAVDLDPAVFPVHGFAQTGIHHVAGLLIRANEDRYELYVPRTFAASTWEVLLDAALSIGYDIVLER
jgi:heterotetrameric sarcosine oxidase gamma subunit